MGGWGLRTIVKEKEEGEAGRNGIVVIRKET
jgi:hypothetical protein